MYLLVVQIKQQELDKLECLCTWVAMVSSFFRKAGMVPLLPARASEQGNVIGLVSVYIYI